MRLLVEGAQLALSLNICRVGATTPMFGLRDFPVELAAPRCVFVARLRGGNFFIFAFCITLGRLRFSAGKWPPPPKKKKFRPAGPMSWGCRPTPPCFGRHD
jgi:hypothetical protein